MPLSRDLQQAKDAYQAGDVQASTDAHARTATERHQQEHGQYIKSAVYGGLDGAITTFAVVAGVAGARLAAGIVLILGFANLIADGLSMAIGDYLGTKSEQEYERAERRREEWEVDHYPQGEKLELVELYVDKGLSHQDAETVVYSNIVGGHHHDRRAPSLPKARGNPSDLAGGLFRRSGRGARGIAALAGRAAVAARHPRPHHLAG